MEPFSLSDLGLLTENKAVQRILGPMAAQLCHLILALEREGGICQAFPHLEEKAEQLAKATEELASVASRLAQESSDEAFEEETRPAAEALVLAGRCVLLAARKLQVQPSDPGHGQELAAAAKRVLTETAKILQIQEAAGTRRITQAASWLLERLSALRDAGDAPGLLAACRAFSEALLLLSNLTAKRLEELGDCPRQKSLAQSLQLLQECVPLLHAAKHSELKHSRDLQVNLSKEDAFQLTERTIKELTALLSGEPQDTNGAFSRHVSGLLALLSRPDPAHLSDGQLSAHVAAVVSYCVLLADSSGPDLKLDLVKRCCLLLRLRKNICSHVRQQEGRSGPSWAESSLEKECHSMREEVETLDRAALAATLCQLLDTFFEGKEPLEQLVEGAGTGCLPAGQGGFLKQLQPLVATFFTHAQQVLRAADFVLARCPQGQRAGDIQEGVEYLRSLLGSLPPLLAEMSGDTAQTGPAERLRCWHRAWAGTAGSLLRRFEETLGTRELLQVSIQEMAKHRACCERALGGQEPQGLSQHAARLASWARWVVGATSRYVDGATDPIFRNGLMVWVEQLAEAIVELEAAAALCPEGLSCLQTRDVFSKAASCLMDAAHQVQEGLDGSNHPDILSPLRERVRSTDVAKGFELSPSPRAGNLHPGGVPREGATHPVITALLAATRARDTAAVSAACSALLELSNGCVSAAKEALPVADSPQKETLGQHQNIALLTPRVISLARETAPRQLHGPSRLLHMALTLSERICETQESLAAVAGAWYSLARQVFGFILSADFLSAKQALEESVMALAGAVQFAGDMASVACKGNPISSDARENFLEVQAKFSRAQMNTKVLLEKAASFEGSCGVGRAGLELHCVRWAISMHVLLGAVDGFVGRDVLGLSELRSAVKDKLCSQSLLAAVSESSLRLQEAARLSYLSCPEDHGRGEILALREEIKVLMEALLDASNILSVSPLSTASLGIRFELLQRDVALRAKALLLHLEKVNAEHLQVIRDVLGPALSPISQEDGERRKEAFEEKASRLMANVQWVKTTLQDVLEASAQLQPRADLLSIADHLLVLTSEAVGSARQLLQSRGDKGHLHLDSIVWHWAAQAHYLLAQLRAVRGISGHVLHLISQRLQDTGDQRSPRQRHSPAKLFPARELDALGHAESAATCPSRSGRASGAAREALDGPLSISLASGPAKQERKDSDTWRGGPSKMSQVTKDMATRMLHMTQFLRKKGPIMSKDQLVTCARQIAADGQVVVRFGRIIAKLCLDRRCSTELLCATEQTHTISSQLSIVARVKAVTAESKSSSELLVSNARNLIQAVLHVLRAAEAACVKGLRQPLPGSEEEEEVAAFCTQWRQNLLWHRAKETQNSARDELGLRKTRARAEPTLTALVQGQSPQAKHIPKSY